MATQLLKSGSKGESVKALQSKLQQLGFDSAADGAFGPATQSAVEELQTLFGYSVDGVVGDGTLKLIDQQVGLAFNIKDPATLKNAIASGKSAPPKQPLRRGSAGADVRFLQRRLTMLGFALAIDGMFGDATDKAVRTLQAAFKYDVDGVLGEATNKLINQQIGYGWTANK